MDFTQRLAIYKSALAVVARHEPLAYYQTASNFAALEHIDEEKNEVLLAAWKISLEYEVDRRISAADN